MQHQRTISSVGILAQPKIDNNTWTISNHNNSSSNIRTYMSHRSFHNRINNKISSQYHSLANLIETTTTLMILTAIMKIKWKSKEIDNSLNLFLPFWMATLNQWYWIVSQAKCLAIQANCSSLWITTPNIFQIRKTMQQQRMFQLRTWELLIPWNPLSSESGRISRN